MIHRVAYCRSKAGEEHERLHSYRDHSCTAVVVVDRYVCGADKRGKWSSCLHPPILLADTFPTLFWTQFGEYTHVDIPSDQRSPGESSAETPPLFRTIYIRERLVFICHLYCLTVRLGRAREELGGWRLTEGEKWVCYTCYLICLPRTRLE